MKANRKFIEADDKAVSAVIGVILMVAITVAIAATVYVYVSGMIGTSPQSAPNIVFVGDDVNDKLTVTKAEPGNHWGDLEVTLNITGAQVALHAGGYTFTISANGSVSGVNSTYYDDTLVRAGDYLEVETTPITVTIRHIPTNTLIDTRVIN